MCYLLVWFERIEMVWLVGVGVGSNGSRLRVGLLTNLDVDLQNVGLVADGLNK